MFFASRVSNITDLFGNFVGTEVTPGASASWGSWTQLISGANNTRGARWFRANILRYYAAGVDRNLFVDIGMRPAGAAGSEIVVVPRLSGSKAVDNQVYYSMGIEYGGPIMIPEGYDVVCRGRASQATPATFYIVVDLLADPVFPHPTAMACESLGYDDVNVVGTDVPVWATDTTGFGTTWTLIGTTTRESKYIDASLAYTGATSSTRWFTARLAAGDATNKTVIATHGCWSWADIMIRKKDFSRLYQKIPAGTNIYAQVACSSSAPSCSMIVYNYF